MVTDCACCGGEIANAFNVPLWTRANWPEISYGTCRRCGSISRAEDVGTEPGRFGYTVATLVPVRCQTAEAIAGSLQRDHQPLAQLHPGEFQLVFASGFGWEAYRDNWISVFAPELAWLPTHDGIRELTRRAGCRINRISMRRSARALILSEMVARRQPPIEGCEAAMSRAEIRYFNGLARRRRHAPSIGIVEVVRDF